MRLFIDTLVALMLAAVLVGVISQHRSNRESADRVGLARSELERLQREIHLQAALEQVTLNQYGFPVTIDPAWFDGDVPFNPLLDDGRPWIEIASAGQRNLEHPLVRCAVSSETAAYWYNPARGVVRARVPSGISDAQALAVYNRVNGCSLDSLYAGDPPNGAGPAAAVLGAAMGVAVR